MKTLALTPMMQQYLDIKASYPSTLLMFRLGDFYELFFDDAVEASRILDITLTGRDAGSHGRIPMCGVPYHAVDQYLTRLIDAGHRIAICEQVEDPKQTKGLVRREVVRVVTPGTAVRDEGSLNRYLCAIVKHHGIFGMAFIDVGTGDVWCGENQDSSFVSDFIQAWRPAEVIILSEQLEVHAISDLNAYLEATNTLVTSVPFTKENTALQTVKDQYRVGSLHLLDLGDGTVRAYALGIALEYILTTQKKRLDHIRTPRPLNGRKAMHLDVSALRNLEVLETTRTRQKRGSLFGVLDQTQTALGSRTLRHWLQHPMSDVEAIRERQDVVEVFSDDVFLAEKVKSYLGRVYDLERLAGRISFGSANARDLLTIAKSLEVIPPLQKCLQETHVKRLSTLAQTLPDFTEVVTTISQTIVDEPPVSVRDGGMIRRGADAELDVLRLTNSDGKSWLAALEQRERETTGIKNLKIGFNKVFGYFIEVSKTNVSSVPSHYERRQTLSTGERYTLPELKEREAEILGAEERAIEREHAIFLELQAIVLQRLRDIQTAALVFGEVDAMLAFALVTVSNGYVRPKISRGVGIRIEAGRHPVVEVFHSNFVPNDVSLTKDKHMILLTGPNMAGKSTYMRQTALIVIMAHIGCFVPATAAEIGLVDRIFTRIGASDDLGAGQSTFMVEMVELAQILRQATTHSLVLLDEIGRGTSTYDGLSIAEAVVEALQIEPGRPLTLFATHYHELTAMAKQFPSVCNKSVAVQEISDGIVFLHAVVPYAADKSYGIQVAKLAGIPSHVVERAEQLLARRESMSLDAAVDSSNAQFEQLCQETIREVASSVETPMMSLFSTALANWLEQVAKIDVLTLTPIDAITILHRLTTEARELKTWDISE